MDLRTLAEDRLDIGVLLVSISIGEAELGSTIVVRIGEGDTCQELRVENNLHFALDYLIRWDYISIRTGASGPIGERRIQS